MEKARAPTAAADRPWFIYFVRCASGEIYTGVATDVARRFAEHEANGA
ncbi:MAG: GIY-YIG nuclease family protein, partial [Pseudomonadota bacterium]